MTGTWRQSSPSPAQSPSPSGRATWPRRSTTDRKVAGVAGGLGRALGMDPVIFRVAFVVLTIFGGFGGLLYVLGWLLLPGDHDEASAAEALLGRGRSSVRPVAALGLAVGAASMLASMIWSGSFKWSVILGAIVLTLAVRTSKGRCAQSRSGRHGRAWSQVSAGSGPFSAADVPWSDPMRRRANRWETKVERQAQRWNDRADRWSHRAWQWGEDAERWVATQPWSAGVRGGSPRARSPFGRPAFWDTPTPAGAAFVGATEGPDATISAAPAAPGVRLTKGEYPAGGHATSTKAPSTVHENPNGLHPAPATRTPPAWDPLGAAPFAWDLPEPTPLPEPGRGRGPSMVSRVTTGIALVAGAVASAGVFGGWWALSWGQVAAVMLTVVGLGLLVSALRGRGLSLIGPGVFLSLVTLALTVTGLRGTDGFGSTTATPTNSAQLQPLYRMNAGNLVLDLTRLPDLNKATGNVTVSVGGGHAEVIVPRGANVDVECRADAGRVDCLDQQSSGTEVARAVAGSDSTTQGRLHILVEVGAGYAEVRNDGAA